MAGSKSLYRSELDNVTKFKQLLAKIKTKHVIIEKGSARYDSRKLTDLVIDQDAADDNISFTPTGDASSGGVTAYDLADIQEIRRLRTSKWLIKIRSSADGAVATP